MAEGEKPSDQSDGAVWAFISLYALGAAAHGFEAIRPDGIVAAIGWWSVAGCLGLIGWNWSKIKRWAGPRLASTASKVATDFRWWIGTVIVFLIVGTFSRFFEEQRWPFSLSEIPVTISEAPPKSIEPLSASNRNMGAALANDFPGTLQHRADYALNIGDKTVNLRIIDFRDPHIGAEFLGAYIPRTTQTYSLTRQIIADHQSLLRQLGSGGIEIRAFGQEGKQTADQTTFTSYVFIYYDGDLSLQQRAELEKYSDALGLRTILRGPEYLATLPYPGGR